MNKIIIAIIIFIFLQRSIFPQEQFSRITPQILSSTVIVDRNFELAKFKDDMLTAFENSSSEELRDISKWYKVSSELYRYIIDNLSKMELSFSKANSGKVKIDSSKLKTINLKSSVKDLTIAILDNQKDQIVKKIDQADTTIDSILSKFIDKINLEIEKIPSVKRIFDIEIKEWDEFKNEIEKLDSLGKDSVKIKPQKLMTDFAKISLQTANLIGDPNLIDAATRVVVLTEIGTEIQNIFSSLEVNYNEKDSLITFEIFADTVFVNFNQPLSIVDFTRNLIIIFSSHIRANLEKRLGTDHNAVQKYHSIFGKIIEPIDTNYNEVNSNYSKGISLIGYYNDFKQLYAVNKPIDDLLKNLSADTSKINKCLKQLEKSVEITNFQTLTFKRFVSETHIVVQRLIDEFELMKNDFKNKANEFRILSENTFSKRDLIFEITKELFINEAKDYIANTLIPQLKDALGKTKGLSIFTNFGISNDPELGSTVSLKLIDKLYSRFEIFTNLLFNEGISSDNASIGFNLNLADDSTSNLGISFLGSASFKDFPKQIRFGGSVYYKWGGFIPRIFVERDIGITSEPVKYKTIAGIELRHKKISFIESIFVFCGIGDGKSFRNFSFGINFPVTK